MANPAHIDRLGGAEPAKRKSEGARLGRFHSQPPVAVLDRHGRHGTIRLISFFVHMSLAEGYGSPLSLLSLFDPDFQRVRARVPRTSSLAAR
jgi:hypothetical protein